MTFFVWLWRWLKKVPGVLWAGLALFFGGLLWGLRLMRDKQAVEIIEQRADKRRKALKEAEKSGDTKRIRDELLKTIKEDKK